jgi:hypothetical protein
VHSQFVQEKADVVSGGLFGDLQGLGDLGRREAMCEQAEDLVLRGASLGAGLTLCFALRLGVSVLQA